MEYSEIEIQAKRWVDAASHSARLAFASDSIRILREASAPAVADELKDTERELLQLVFLQMGAGDINQAQHHLNALLHSTTEDDVRAVELDPDLTELFCCLDGLLKYRGSGDTREIIRVAISMINHVDYVISGEDGHYSVHNMLGNKRMVGEIERQERLLRAEPSPAPYGSPAGSPSGEA